MDSTLSTWNEFELRYPLRSKNGTLSGTQRLQKSKLVQGGIIWDIELMSTSEFPPIEYHHSNENNISAAAPINGEVSESYESAIKGIDAAVADGVISSEVSSVQSIKSENTLVERFGQIFYNEERTEKDSDDEQIQINVTLSKKDLKNNLLTLRKIKHIDQSDDEPLYAVVRKDKKKKKTTESERNEYNNVTIENDSKKAPLGDCSLDEDIVRQSLPPLESSPQIIDDEISDPGYESLHAVQEEIQRSRCNTPKPVRGRSFEEVEMTFHDFDSNYQKPDFISFLPTKKSADDSGIKEDFETVSVNHSTNNGTDTVKETFGQSNDSFTENEKENQIVTRETNITGKQQMVDGKKSVRIKDTAIVLPKLPKNVTEFERHYGATSFDHDSIRSTTSSKNSFKKDFRLSMPTSLLRYFDHKQDRNSGDFSSLRYNEKAGYFGSTDSLTGIGTKKVKKDKKKTFTLRKKVEPPVINEGGDYQNFLLVEDNDHVDLDKEIKEMIQMNSRKQNLNCEEPPPQKSLFDVPEQLHFDTKYASQERRMIRDLKSGPRFTSMTNKQKIDYSREAKVISESLLY